MILNLKNQRWIGGGILFLGFISLALAFLSHFNIWGSGIQYEFTIILLLIIGSFISIIIGIFIIFGKKFNTLTFLGSFILLLSALAFLDIINIGGLDFVTQKYTLKGAINAQTTMVISIILFIIGIILFLIGKFNSNNKT